jgi:hypothetical protein
MKALILSLLLAGSCPPDDIHMSRAEYEAIELRLCGPDGSVSRDEQGPVCSDPWWRG